ncbi:MAG: LPS assembly protein LptD [Oceanospirillaceae bacterium]|nr:LPS assembly protein LptD [Oceanospirillaceae bacterium]
MQFNLHRSQKLSLAIITAILASTQTFTAAGSSWDCLQVAGQWDCSATSNTPETDPLEAITASGIEPPLTLSNTVTNTQLVEPPTELITTPTKSVEPQPNPSNTVAKAPLVEPPKEQVTTATSQVEPQLNSSNTVANAQLVQPPAELIATPIPSISNPRPEVAVSKASTATVPQDEIINQTAAKKTAPSNRAITLKDKPAPDPKDLDWYTYTQDENHYGVCQGRYISPTIGAFTEGEAEPLDLSTVFITADQSSTALGQNSVLTGNVDIRQGTKSLNSPVVKLNQETGAMDLEGGVTYRQTGLLIVADNAKGNINNDQTSLYNAQYVVHDIGLRGEAEAIISQTTDIIDIQNGSLTFCPPNVEDWKISASNINLDLATGFGKADDAKLVLMGQTVLYLPFLYFPLDDRRHSGFLYPSFKFANDGNEVAIPYYFNIATNMDDTLTTTVNSDNGILLENELRYLDTNSVNKISTGLNVIDDQDARKRWVIGLNHKGNYSNFKTVIDYTKISDDDYFDDFGSNLDVDEGDNNHLNQTAKISYAGDNWNSSLLLQKYQTIDSDTTTPYQRLPEIRFSGITPEPWDNINIKYRTVFTRFDRDQTGLSDAEKVNGDRLIIQPSINASYRKAWGYIQPSVKLWHASYNLNDQLDGVGSNQSVTVPILEIDSGLYFDRDFSFQEKGYTQTLEPRLYGLYVPYSDQSELPDFDTSELTFNYNSLFRDNRFSGDDRFGDTKQISLGLTTRVISDQGRELVTASLGHALYFADRKVRVDSNAAPIDDDTSDLATSIIWRPNTRVRALIDATFDAKTFDNSEFTLDLKYEEDPSHVIGFRHRFTRDIREQTTLSYLWPISNNWSGLGLVQYDWLSNKTIDVAGGLEYQSCCWLTRMVVRNELDSNNSRDISFAFQFVLKGLGGAGRSPNQDLRDKIKGYDKREYYNANN